MTVYTQPYFWACLSTLIGGVLGAIKLYFSNKDKTNAKQFERESTLEDKKRTNIQMALDLLSGAIARIDPLVQQQGDTQEDLKNSIAMVNKIQNMLTFQMERLEKGHEEFQRKIINVTASFQKVLDRMEKAEERIEQFGKVILK